LMLANPLFRPLEGVALKILLFCSAPYKQKVHL
jgi:hypothetical protein